MAGALIGGFLVARSRARHALRIGVAVVALDALPLLALADTAPLALLMTAMFVNGLALEQFGVAWDLSLQENVPADRLSRVYSYNMLGSILALPIGEMTASGLAERFGNHTTLLGGVCLVVTVTGLALCNKQVRSLITGTSRVATEALVTPPPEDKAPGSVPEPAPVPTTEATSPQNPAR
ncbi:hypothetical protein WKI65_32190 [Streptomyces sp. MS1.AVA.3]|uniref:hypothetical protein n=1 Tax=Streptomyces decoyicus TaxID=249567 RepID=UPI0030C2D8A4